MTQPYTGRLPATAAAQSPSGSHYHAASWPQARTHDRGSEPGRQSVGDTVGQIQDLMRRVAANRAGLFAVHVRLDGLWATPQHVRRMLARPLEALRERREASLFPLGDDGFILVCRDVPVEEVDAAIYNARAYASSAPAARRAWAAQDAAHNATQDANTAATWYDLADSRDFDRFVADVRTLKAGAATSARREPHLPRQDQLLDSKTLAAIGRRLDGIGISDLIRQQTAIELHRSGTATPLFCETYVSISALLARFAPNVEAPPNSCLFRHFTETLDRRLMASVVRRKLPSGSIPMSVNLSISTIATPAFQQFHVSRSSGDAGLVVELQLVDVLTDTEAYRQARDSLRARGYKVLIDGLNPVTPRFINIAALDADYFKIWWSPDVLHHQGRERIPSAHRLVEAAGREKVLLARTDSEDAVKWGLSLGIHRFQGYLIDRIGAAMRLQPAT